MQKTTSFEIHRVPHGWLLLYTAEKFGGGDNEVRRLLTECDATQCELLILLD